MKQRHRRVTVALAAAIAVAAGGCDTASPAGPTSLAGVVTVTVTGPALLAPGVTGAYTAIANRSDGSTTDVTHQATWSSSRTDVLLPALGGQATAGSIGESQLRATYGSLSLPLTVTVLEPGTFRVTGRLRDAGTGSPILNGRIDVTAGAAAGRSTLTDLAGRFTLFGLAGPVRLRASRPFYLDREVDLEVVETTGDVELDLDPVRPAADLNGDWRLTLSDGPVCPHLPDGVVPQEIRLRISHEGVRLTAEVLGPMLWNADRIVGFVIDRDVNLSMPGGWDDWESAFFFAVLFRALPTGLIGPAGSLRVTIPVDSRVLTGEFAGAFHFYEGTVINGPGLTCGSRWSAALEPAGGG